MKKGNVVQFPLQGVAEPIQGIVKSVGVRVKVVYKHPNKNGLYEVSPTLEVAKKLMKVIAEKAELPKGLETLEIKGYKEIGTSDGVCFNANIYFKGKAVATIENGGFGGPTDVSTKMVLVKGEYSKHPLATELFAIVEKLFENIDKESLPMCDGALSYFFESYMLGDFQNFGTKFEDWLDFQQKDWAKFKSDNNL